MGLILPTDPTDVTTPVTKTYTRANTLVSDSVLPVTYVRVCTDGSSSSGNADAKSFDKTLYRLFSMRDDMKVLQFNGKARNEFELFLEYAEKKTSGTPYDSKFDQLDEYLGSIGVTNEMCRS